MRRTRFYRPTAPFAVRTAGGASAVGGGGGGVTIPALSRHFNSREAGGDGSAPNLVFADSFERGPGNTPWWYRQNADNDDYTDGIGEAGWEGHIYGPQNGSGNPINPLNAIDADFNGVGGKQYCAAYGDPADPANGLTNRVGAVHQAWHDFDGGSLTELRARWYAKWDEGAQFSGEKHTNFTKRAGDITWFNIQLNCGASAPTSTATPSIQIIHGTDICQACNIDPITLTTGKYYCFEVYVRLNSSGTTPDGAIDLFITDCGADGLSPVDDSGTPVTAPILRTRMTSVAFDRNQTGCEDTPCAIEVLYFERWANSGEGGSSGKAWLDCIWTIAGNNGGVPIGFVDPELFP